MTPASGATPSQRPATDTKLATMRAALAQLLGDRAAAGQAVVVLEGAIGGPVPEVVADWVILLADWTAGASLHEPFERKAGPR